MNYKIYMLHVGLIIAVVGMHSMPVTAECPVPYLIFIILSKFIQGVNSLVYSPIRVNK